MHLHAATSFESGCGSGGVHDAVEPMGNDEAVMGPGNREGLRDAGVWEGYGFWVWDGDGDGEGRGRCRRWDGGWRRVPRFLGSRAMRGGKFGTHRGMQSTQCRRPAFEKSSGSMQGLFYLSVYRKGRKGVWTDWHEWSSSEALGCGVARLKAAHSGLLATVDSSLGQSMWRKRIRMSIE